MTLHPSLENRTLAGTTAIVTGASRGFGRAIAETLATAGAHVVGVARSGAAVAADAADPEVANRLIGEHKPHTLVLCAGATPTMRPLHEQTWESFSQNWNVDVAQAFHWTRAALTLPLAPGSTVILVSSGAALNGSPLSGGYAGAKAAVKFVADYAALESDRAGLGIRFTSVLPRLTAATEMGAEAVAAYADRQGVDIDAFLRAAGPPLTAEQVGRSVLELATRPLDGSYLLTAAGLSELN
ncbi:SDR family oxidoreductase [Candidatus Mycobacterium wuenschmannii]|uniref:SDR family oxidoreductase n=1 Tax=Candidatus Mycobacterium wuenschmannii TaxID=3027808 RepID=A0ABY8VT98_9MYCO|nr:SDR family oxidoreductase [Candidatus Mycobacterium wuenschmannii]WIM86853.1 SDR family oxidoreductase [Candidatus Mycobacterium wuenschmannii]